MCLIEIPSKETINRYIETKWRTRTVRMLEEEVLIMIKVLLPEEFPML